MDIESIDNFAFDEVYETYADQVYQTALYYSRNEDTAEEITHTVFMKLYDYEKKSEIINLGNWLIVVTRNTVYDYYKKAKREVLVDDISSVADGVVHTDSAETEFLKKINAEKRAHLVHKIYTDLYSTNERWYEAVRLTYRLKLPQEEGAKRMGVSLGSFQLMLYRAKRWIKKRYQEEFDQLDDV